jgi:hypothetical protein
MTNIETQLYIQVLLLYFCKVYSVTDSLCFMQDKFSCVTGAKHEDVGATA